jgi:hypothetical protein
MSLRGKKRDLLRDAALREWEAWSAKRRLAVPATGDDGFLFFLQISKKRPEIAVVEWQTVHTWLRQAGKVN